MPLAPLAFIWFAPTLVGVALLGRLTVEVAVFGRAASRPGRSCLTPALIGWHPMVHRAVP